MHSALSGYALLAGRNHGFGAPNYAVSRDGKRFVMIRSSDKPLTRVVVLLNLPAELASRFAAGKR